LAWAFAQALIDGWHRRFASRFTRPDEYLHEVRRFGNIPAALHDFAGSTPDWWNTQIAGHPPRAPRVLVVHCRWQSFVMKVSHGSARHDTHEPGMAQPDDPIKRLLVRGGNPNGHQRNTACARPGSDCS
jgi:hypothetical protein